MNRRHFQRFNQPQEAGAELHRVAIKAEPYRGKVLSLEQQEHSYTGESTGITVLRLNRVEREQVILPTRSCTCFKTWASRSSFEQPLPDDIGRSKIVRLYSEGVTLADSTIEEIVRRTDGVSPAFIKELMRRSV